MNKNVRNAVSCLLKEEHIVSSWGISNISIEDSSIHFSVDGFIYQGNVCIKCNNDYYEILFDDGKTIRCSVQELTDVLDTAIEKNENYFHNLKTWILSHG